MKKVILAAWLFMSYNAHGSQGIQPSDAGLLIKIYDDNNYEKDDLYWSAVLHEQREEAQMKAAERRNREIDWSNIPACLNL